MLVTREKRGRGFITLEKCGKEESNLGWSVKSEDWLPRRGARVTEVLSAKMW